MSKTAERFKEVRSALGLTLAEMGSLLDVSELTVHRWEHGEPLLNEEKRRFIQSLGVNPVYILCDFNCDMLLPKKTITDVRDAVRTKLAEKEVSA